MSKVLYTCIDTNIYIYLLREEYNQTLNRFKFLIEDNQMKLVVPMAVIEEFKRKSLQTIENISKNGSVKLFMPKNYVTDTVSKMTIKRDQLIDLLENQSLIIDYNNEIINRSFNWRQKVMNLSERDSQILFSSLYFLEENEEEKLFFISNNTSDFSGSEKHQLHDDISTLFKSHNLDYYTNIDTFINKNLPSLPVKGDNTHRLNKEYYFIYEKFKNKSISKNLVQMFDEIYNGLNFIIPYKLCKTYPFFDPKSSYKFSNHLETNLDINNEEFYEYIKNVFIQFDGYSTLDSSKFKTNQEFEDTIDVFKRLNLNLIHSITLKNKSNSKLYILLKDQGVDEDHNCFKCDYTNFKFYNSYLDINQKISKGDIYESFKTAFYNYKFGNYIESYELFKKIESQCVNKKNSVKFSICIINRQRIGKKISYLYRTQEGRSIAKEAEELDLKNELKKNNFEYNKIIESISNLDYLYYGLFNPLLNNLEIKDRFVSNERGGYRQSNEFVKLFYGYFGFINYIEENFIVFDYYMETRTITRSVFESYLYSSNDKVYKQELPYFLIKKCIYYLTDDIIIKTLISTDTNKIYESETSEKLNFISISKSVIDSFLSFKENRTEFLTSYDNFYDKLEQMIVNIYSLASCIKLEEKSHDYLLDTIITFFENGITSHRIINSVNFYINNQKVNLKSERILNVINSFNEDIFERKTNLLDTTILIVYRRELIIKNDVINRLFKYKNFTLLNIIYPKLGRTHKRKLRSITHNKLKTNFSTYFLFRALMNKVIKLEQYEDQVVKVINNSFNKEVHIRSNPKHSILEEYNHDFNELINYIYAYNKDQSIFGKINFSSDFYTFVTNPEGYKKDIDLKWLEIINTGIPNSMKKISKNKNLKKQIRESLLKEKNSYLSEIYIKRFT